MMKPESFGGAARPNPSPNDDFPWWIKYGVRFLGSITAVASLVLGAMACLTITASCLLAGIFLMLSGVLIALIEAPFLCLFLDFAQVPSAFFDGKPPWVKGLLFIVIAIIPISLCAGLTTFFGSGLIFVLGSLYGLVSLKRKAPLQDMQMQASRSNNFQNPISPKDLESGESQRPFGAI